MKNKSFKISLIILLAVGIPMLLYVFGARINPIKPLYWKNSARTVSIIGLCICYVPFLIVLHTIKNALSEKRVKEKQLLDLYFKAMIIVPLIIFPIWLYMTIKGDYSIKFH